MLKGINVQMCKKSRAKSSLKKVEENVENNTMLY